MSSREPGISNRGRIGPAVVVVGAIVLAGAALFALGREPICTCGTVKLWHGVAQSSENSQHLSDWYTPSHVIHGILFFWLTSLFASRLSLGWRFAIAVAVEATWEVLENSPFIIDRYRAATISLDYYGDSILNSMADIGAMIAGFVFAASVRWWASVALVLVLEIGVAIVIRDNLLLNILMLLHPFEAIRHWQAGA